MSFVHDIIIIGAGPCGLATAARLCEQTPSELFTDEEHRRYQWIRKNRTRKPNPSRSGVLSTRNASEAGHDEQKKPSSSPCKSPGDALVEVEEKGSERPPGQKLGGYNTLVIDATGNSFLSRWRTYFETFDISHLRSPMFFHLDPSDRDGLLAFAQRTSRYCNECQEIKGVVGKELSKHARKKRSSTSYKRQTFGEQMPIDQRDRQDYCIPSRELFLDHCQSIINRYRIDEKKLILHDVVWDIKYAEANELIEDLPSNLDSAEKIFQVTTRNGEQYARAVVVAIGPSMSLSNMVLWPPNAACHSSQIREFPSPQVKEKIKVNQPTNILIVGGGLTSAQLALLAIKKGVSKVWLIMRGGLKVKHFDLDLEWVGKFKNREKAVFWSADTDGERLQMIRKARNGGSLPPKYVKLLDQEVAAGKLSIHTHTTLRAICERRDGGSTWPVLTEPMIPNLPEMDYIYFATGPNGLNRLSMPSCSTEGTPEAAPDTALPVPFLESLQLQFPIHWLNGLPILTDELAWYSPAEKKGQARNIPLFMTGALAALRLGPGAANLEGARVGDERVVWGIQDALDHDESLAEGLTQDRFLAYVRGEGGKFHALFGLEGDG